MSLWSYVLFFSWVEEFGSNCRCETFLRADITVYDVVLVWTDVNDLIWQITDDEEYRDLSYSHCKKDHSHEWEKIWKQKNDESWILKPRLDIKDSRD